MLKAVDDPTDEFAVLRNLLTDVIGPDPLAARAAEPGLVERLRTYERTAREADVGRQTMQVIMSARRLIGDRLTLELDGSAGRPRGRERRAGPRR